MHFQTVFSFVFPKSRTKDHHEPRAGYATETKIFEFLENDWNRIFYLYSYLTHRPRWEKVNFAFVG